MQSIADVWKDRRSTVSYTHLVEHHMTGKDAVHNAKNSQKVQERLHQIGQQEFEKTHTREEFRKIFGRSYL